MNIVAVVYGALMTINIGWPRATRLRPRGQGLLHAVLRAACSSPATLLVGLIAFLVQRGASAAARPGAGEPATAEA